MRMKVSSGSGRVENGVVDIPGIPDPEIVDIPDQERKPCRLRVSLRAVSYGGDNVGSSWRYHVFVNGGIWDSGFHTMVHGHSYAVSALVHDETVPSGCGLLQDVAIVVRARERDWWIFDDVGEGYMVSLASCVKEGWSRHVSVHVAVPEYPFAAIWSLFRLRRKVALLHFVFVIETQCIDG